MMVDNTENNEFRELLSDYAAPISDDGFSDHILMQANTLQNQTLQNQVPQNVGAIKNIMVGIAALLATFTAIPQLGKLKQLVGGVQLPELALPANVLETASMPTMTIFALLALLIVSLSGSFLFSSDI